MYSIGLKWCVCWWLVAYCVVLLLNDRCSLRVSSTNELNVKPQRGCFSLEVSTPGYSMVQWCAEVLKLKLKWWNSGSQKIWTYRRRLLVNTQTFQVPQMEESWSLIFGYLGGFGFSLRFFGTLKCLVNQGPMGWNGFITSEKFPKRTWGWGCWDTNFCHRINCCLDVPGS